VKRVKSKEKDYGKALLMNAFEKKISFLNRYFVYKKIRNVNAAKVELELTEESNVNVVNSIVQTKKVEKETKKVIKEVKPKIRKLDKTLTLEEGQNKEEALAPKTKKKQKSVILIEEDDEED
jgi:hypothetical protein